ILRSDGIPVTVFADSVEKETVARFTHPPELNRKIKPASLTDEFWRIKVAEFAESNSARRLAVILNHQGPPIPAHVLPVSTGFIVVAGPFNSVKEAQASVNRLRIDFALRPELIQPSKIIPELQDTTAFFSRILSILDWTSN
ncbi:MAG: SPOR domain-containing protein, partial [Methylococcales bacterium]|nr:SPOR domain-containing protein [Methylococcales bacterium]